MDSTWRMGDPIPEPTHWPQPPPDMDPAQLLSSVHLDDPDDPIPPELLQPEGAPVDLGPGQILAPRRRSASARAAGMVSSARARTQGASLAAQQAIGAPPAPQQQQRRPAPGQTSVPAPDESRLSARAPREPTSGVLSSAAAPRGRPPRKPRRGAAVPGGLPGSTVPAAAGKAAGSAKGSKAARKAQQAAEAAEAEAEAGRAAQAQQQQPDPEPESGEDAAGSFGTQQERDQQWWSMWDNEQLEGVMGANLLAPKALAELQPETMAEEDLVALGQELTRQQMNARSGAQAVQEASLEELIDREAYTEVWPALLPVCCRAEGQHRYELCLCAWLHAVHGL